MDVQQDAKETLKRLCDIVELVGQVVQLKRAGRNYVGLCPFHSEKSPSFTVNPEKQIFHCFGCRKGGDIFAFWMEYHGLGFREALEDLAERYQVPLPRDGRFGGDSEAASRRERLYGVHQRAYAYFCGMLADPSKGRPVRDYLAQRAISMEIAAECGLGYAPAEWDGLERHLRKGGADLKGAAEAGLMVAKAQGRYYDRFRGRLMFPIRDARGKIIAFGGRVLDDALPKYLNSPESEIFRKGETLYGLDKAHAAIRKAGRVFVVEGYMDWLRLYVNGIHHVVATLGTALTTAHVRRLKGYAPEAVLVYDADDAGQAAVLRSLPLFAAEGLLGRALKLPAGHDPDSFVRQEGPAALLQGAEEALPLFDFCIQERLKDLPAKSSDEGYAIVRDVLPILAQLGSDIQRALYVRRLSEMLRIREESLWAELGSLQNAQTSRAAAAVSREPHPVPEEARRISDYQLLSLILRYPEAIERLSSWELDILSDDRVVRRVLERVFAAFRQAGWPAVAQSDVMHEASPEGELLREVLSRPYAFVESEIELAVTELEAEFRRRQVTRAFREAKASGDVARLVRLTETKRSI